ncbi:MAG: hypothetical protein KUG77_05580, partial [Nannocystaceae bacterium]|nr:hypothetical protein [Nannocystaceae bacterium]
ADIYASRTEVVRHHLCYTAPIVIDARLKPHHAPPLLEDPDVERQVDALATRGGSLHGIV